MALKIPRKKTGKSRTGCRQCKTRRVKCDEKAPECNNCSRRGVKCPGYERGLRFSVKHERFLDNGVSPAAAASPIFEITASSQASSNLSAPKSSSEVIQLDANINDAQATDITLQTQKSTEMSLEWDDLSWLDDWNDMFQPSSDLESSPASANITDVALSDSRPSQGPPLSSAFFHNPIDLPTTLVEYWFRHVCPMWSSFDSEANYNRRVPLHTWTTSEPVFYALQAMSAACLADSMPEIDSVLPSLITQATATIRKKMSAFRSSPSIPSLSINIDLLFAVFAMGTSLHWADSSQFGDEMLQDAREALGILTTNLSAVDAMVHAHFHQALTYWEMMYSIVDRGLPKNRKLDRKRLKYQTRLVQAMQLDHGVEHSEQTQRVDESGALQTIRPHSWCGLSSEVIDVFGQVLALCRCARIRHRGRKSWTAAATTDALSDIGVAHDLQQELLAMDFDDVADGDKLRGVSLQTGDEKTPLSHLVHIAEAYRQASLIQLYLTFDDLEIKRSPNVLNSMSAFSTRLPIAEEAAHEEKLLVMALELVAVLEQVPADSGSRCIHPPLLILAAAGLRNNVNICDREGSTGLGKQALQDEESPDPLQLETLMENAYNPSWDATSTNMSLLPQGIYTPLSDTLGNLNITRATLEMAKARQFIKGRLHALQTNLPPRPIQIALDLVHAIWTKYDDTSPSSDAHWLDVMNQTGLQTIFG